MSIINKYIYIIFFVILMIFSGCGVTIYPLVGNVSPYNNVIENDKNLNINIITLPSDDNFCIELNAEYNDDNGKRYLSRQECYLEVWHQNEWHMLVLDFDKYEKKGVLGPAYEDYPKSLSEFIFLPMSYYGTALKPGTYRAVVKLEDENNSDDIIYVCVKFILDENVVANSIHIQN